MPIVILCTHHKGGVGKTTLAVHVAGALQQRPVRILLIDCDSQADSWRFFTRGAYLQKRQVSRVNPRLSLLWNPDRQAVRQIVNIVEYDYIVLDVDTALETTIIQMIEANPELVLVPVNQQHLALIHLPDTLGVIARIEQTAGYSPQVTVVPLGILKKSVEEAVEGCLHRPGRLIVASKVRNLRGQYSAALADCRLIWEYPDCDDQLAYYSNLLGVLS